MSGERNQTLGHRGEKRKVWRLSPAVVVFVFFTHYSLLSTHDSVVQAAVSKGQNQELEAAGFSEGGPGASSSKYRHQLTVGEQLGGGKMTTSRYRLTPGVLGAAASAPTAWRRG